MTDSYWSLSNAAEDIFVWFITSCLLLGHQTSDTARCIPCTIFLWRQQKKSFTVWTICSKNRTGFLIIISLLSSAQGKASISCQRVWVHKLVFSKVQPIVRTGLFITSLCDSMPTHCFTSWWFCYYRWGSQVWDWWQKIRLESKRRVWLIQCCQRICIHVQWELQRTPSHTHNPHAYMETRWDFTRIEYSCQSDKWKTTACVSVILCLIALLTLDGCSSA